MRQQGAIDGFLAGVLRGRARDGTLGFEGRTIIGYGNGAWGGGRAPSARIRASAERIFGHERVIDTDEFLTTATCHVCGDVLQGIIDTHKNFLRGAPAGALDRGLKRCARSSCSSFLDRDVNVGVGGWVWVCGGGGGGRR